MSKQNSSAEHSVNQVPFHVKLVDLSVEDMRVESLMIDYNKKKYCAEISGNEIKISDATGYDEKNIGVFNTKTKQMTWYREHVCGLAGFGTSIHDVCEGCKSPKFTADYSKKNLAEMLKSEMPSAFSFLGPPKELPLVIVESILNIEKIVLDYAKK